MIVKKAFVQATLLWVAGIIFTLAFSRWALPGQQLQQMSCHKRTDRLLTDAEPDSREASGTSTPPCAAEMVAYYTTVSLHMGNLPLFTWQAGLCMLPFQYLLT
jgi:hypothetical protein